MLTRRRVVVALACVIVVLIVATVWLVQPAQLARLGAGYGAKQTCSCRFISGRTLDSCRGDLDRIAQRVVSIEERTNEVTASALGLSSATARFEPGFGCTLVD